MSPVRIKWSGEHYYLSAVNPEHGELHSYRIDRIRALAVDRGTWIFAEERDSGFRQFEMFEPQAQKTVIFRIHRKLIDMAVEVLGPGAVFQADKDPDWSRVSADVEISEGFYRWVLQQSGKLEVLAPESVRAEIKKRLKEMLARYSE